MLLERDLVTGRIRDQLVEVLGCEREAAFAGALALQLRGQREVEVGCYDEELIGAEVHSMELDMSTQGRDVTVLFGDGAGAGRDRRATNEAHMILSTHIHADGSEAETLWTEYSNPGCRLDRGLLANDCDATFEPGLLDIGATSCWVSLLDVAIYIASSINERPR